VRSSSIGVARKLALKTPVLSRATIPDNLRAYPKLIHYNKVDKGGHFAAWEQPKLFSEELRSIAHVFLRKELTLFFRAYFHAIAVQRR
jgi:pimeloyl-ACP methyl ester carboxylesterase